MSKKKIKRTRRSLTQEERLFRTFNRGEGLKRLASVLWDLYGNKESGFVLSSDELREAQKLVMEELKLKVHSDGGSLQGLPQQINNKVGFTFLVCNYEDASSNKLAYDYYKLLDKPVPWSQLDPINSQEEEEPAETVTPPQRIQAGAFAENDSGNQLINDINCLESMKKRLGPASFEKLIDLVKGS